MSRPKRIKSPNLDAAENRHTTLCDLPDDVLRRILYSLPTLDAVPMSMASKRLESLFRSVPKLEFDWESYYLRRGRNFVRDRRHFMDVVDRSLRLRDEGSSITEFTVSGWLECFDTSRVREWISNAVLQHNVQDLCLLLYRAPYSSLGVPIKLLPSCILQSGKLRKLHLQGVGALPTPPRVYLPSLKDLALRSVSLVDHELTEKLLSSPSLEKLSIEGCSFEMSKPVITFSAPMLNTLSVSQCGCPELAIHAPNLKRVFYGCGLEKRFLISGSPVLDEVDVRLCRPSEPEDVCINLRRLLQDISCVKNRLTISTDGLVKLMRRVDPFPEFSNLRNLNVIRDYVYPLDSERPYVFLDLDPLCPLLRRCPSIETLELHLDVDWWNMVPPEIYEDRFPPNLKKVTINGFFGSDRQLRAVGFLLMRAPALEELVLKYKVYTLSGRVRQPKLLDEHYFSTLPRVSERCIFRIIPPPIQ